MPADGKIDAADVFGIVATTTGAIGGALDEGGSSGLSGVTESLLPSLNIDFGTVAVGVAGGAGVAYALGASPVKGAVGGGLAAVVIGMLG